MLSHPTRSTWPKCCASCRRPDHAAPAGGFPFAAEARPCMPGLFSAPKHPPGLHPIEPPDRFTFHRHPAAGVAHQLRQPSDNAQLLGIVSEARIALPSSPWAIPSRRRGPPGIIVADAALQYRPRPPWRDHAGGDGRPTSTSTAATWCGAWRGRPAGARSRGKTGIVFFDYGQRRKATVPEGFGRRFVPA